tara:strand:+ start:170 stop:331 length:162 start_codon:yes stop_codon:yes gene_type:complete
MRKPSKNTITSTGNKRLYEMGPIDAIKLIAYPTNSISMLDGKVYEKPKPSKSK